MYVTRISIAAFLLFFMISCNMGVKTEVTRKYPTGENQEEISFTGQGDDKQLISRTGYFRNGEMSFQEMYQDGAMVSYNAWWPTGQLKTVRAYSAGEITQEEHFDSDDARQLNQSEIDSILVQLQEYPGEPATADDIVVMETTAGTMKFRLFTDVAPGHSDNIKRLANFGYYNGTTFHRIVPGFVIQGGDILSRDQNRGNDGSGDPGYTIDAEFNPMMHVRGSLAMARSSDPNSAGSQFYIALARLAQLDNRYTVFGELIEGDEVLAAIAAAPTDSRDNPITPQRILSVRVAPE